MKNEIIRALAYIAQIDEIRPIPNYDRVEHARVKGWWIIVKKDEFKVGDLCVYYEIDSKVPSNDERYSFLEKKHYKVKTIKMCGAYSQGLALPVSLFPELKDKNIGDDVTNELKITYSSEEDIKRKSNKVDPEAKYVSMKARHRKIFSNPFIKKMMKHKWFKEFMFILFGKKSDKPKSFPDWIVKTDETRIENAPFYLQSADKWIKTEKLDGTSCTFALDLTKKKPDFIVCSRNVRQLDKEQACYHESNIYWELADKYNLKEVLTNIANEYHAKRIVIQGEGVGNVQGNPYKLKENDLYVFNVIIDGKRFNSTVAQELIKGYGLKFVPIIDSEYELPKTMEEMKLEAEGCSMVNDKVEREGFVYRSLDGINSFKNVSRTYLLKHNG